MTLRVADLPDILLFFTHAGIPREEFTTVMTKYRRKLVLACVRLRKPHPALLKKGKGCHVRALFALDDAVVDACGRGSQISSDWVTGIMTDIALYAADVLAGISWDKARRESNGWECC